MSGNFLQNCSRQCFFVFDIFQVLAPLIYGIMSLLFVTTPLITEQSHFTVNRFAFFGFLLEQWGCL